jgi:hypothetical protein
MQNSHQIKSCIDCNRRLEKDVIALNKKLFDINVKKFMCLKCMSIYLDVSVDDLLVKIDELKESGCTLFS